MTRRKLEPRNAHSTGEERRSFGLWIALFVALMFAIPLLLKWAGLLPARR